MEEKKPKRKRRTKKEIELIRSTNENNSSDIGLGDTVERVLEATGISKIAKWLLGEDCGCNERKEKLNKLFPYRRQINCLTEDEYNYLKGFFAERKTRLKPTEQMSILNVYNRIFNIRQEPSNCVNCWKRILNELQTVLKEYEEEQ